MRDYTFAAILYALYHSEISAAVAPIKRTVTEQTVEIFFLYVFMAGVEFAVLIAEILVMLHIITPCFRSSNYSTIKTGCIQ